VKLQLQLTRTDTAQNAEEIKLTKSESKNIQTRKKGTKVRNDGLYNVENFHNSQPLSLLCLYYSTPFGRDQQQGCYFSVTEF
jgi:hypothetical protein